MATGRIRRTARRGLAVAVLGWLGVTTAAVLLAPTASAAPSVTVQIKNLTPPAASVDAGGTVTFVNAIPAQNKGGISIPLVGTFSATVYTDVAVTFFGQQRPLQQGQSVTWTFDDPVTPGSIAYTYRIVPQAGLAVSVANQVINTVAAGLPALPAPTPFAVQTIAPAVPNLPGVNVPQLPQVTVPNPLPPGSAPLPGAPGGPLPPVDGAGGPVPPSDQVAGPEGVDGTPYQYGTGSGVTGMAPLDASAAAAFDPSRFYIPGESLGTPSRGGSGSGGVAGQYEGASVPVFGELAGLNGSGLDEGTQTVSSSDPAPQTLPIAALAAVVALATVTAALVRLQQAARGSR